MAIGERIKMAREENGWSQEEFARQIEVEPPTVSRWETGANEPRPKMWPRITKALGYPREWFEGLESDRISGLEARMQKIENSSQSDLASFQIENVRLKRELAEIKSSIMIPPEVIEAWPKAPAEVKATCLYMLTRKKEFLNLLSEETLTKVLSAVRSSGLKNSKAPR